MPGPIDYTKIRIVADPDTKEWWEATKQHRYLVRQCKDCEHKWFPPFPACSKCGSMNLTWMEIKGEGIIHSYVVIEQPILAAFVKAVPYLVAVIELPETREKDGSVTRVAGVLLDNEKDVAIGFRVRPEYEASNDPNMVIPRWKVTAKVPGAKRFDGTKFVPYEKLSQ